MNRKMKRRVSGLLIGIAFIGIIVLLVMTFSDGRHSEYVAKAITLKHDVDEPHAEIARLKRQLALLKKKGCNLEEDLISLPVIFAVTPTYARPEQKAELTRLYQTLLLVPNLHWVIVEDAEAPTPLVKNLLASSGLSHTHLHAHTPPAQKLKAKDPHWAKPRGVLQRNTALEWLRSDGPLKVAPINPDGEPLGVVYFADDDNSYSIRLFEEMRYVQNVGVWPVGLVGGLMVERPLPSSDGRGVASFNAGYKPERPFPIDMAGFAINLATLRNHPDAKFLYEVQPGYQESQLLKQLTTKQELEVLADNCTKVYVWHTRTDKPKMREELQWKAQGRPPSNQDIEV
ncbi:galactosylgalactosylxylosylprotein 3-beta-glucuronosyltransferase I [Neocloeon triangulifer]|uniref:galactosylgalactosylxylosylprotein 3-beta-glucuronosyltransferase I n=1 Tax=Neocloeon triangulifer TaxID=2078957 RepID=UPI00286F801E|nr:galactosylgalactosylxylosylprotein 3-beta-glucuronosyltransferase I [Neocloeon triangulifer]